MEILTLAPLLGHEWLCTLLNTDVKMPFLALELRKELLVAAGE